MVDTICFDVDSSDSDIKSLTRVSAKLNDVEGERGSHLVTVDNNIKNQEYKKIFGSKS